MGASDDDPADGSPQPDNKVLRVVEKYGLDDLPAELEAHWTGKATPRRSLRELETMFNRRVLAAAMATAGMSTVDHDIEHTYRSLTDDSVSEGVRTQTRGRLDSGGVDVSSVKRDFVSHQSIHTYLVEERDVTRPDDGVDPIESDVETIQRLNSRTRAVIESAIERHDDADRIDVGAVDLLLDTRVICQDCGADMNVVDLFEAGGCACDR
jgi:hypothetical protein